jgi:hypothetical protein
MRERIEDSRFLEWLRELFTDASAESMFRWVIVAWAILVLAMVVMDRFGSGLLGRSRPLVQAPPERARTWRWGRRTPPTTYSLLPTGTTLPGVSSAASTPAESIPLSTRPLAAIPERSSASMVVPNLVYWQDAADPVAPLFGYENNERLGNGEAPERYNPITGRVEALDRDERTGRLYWPGDSESPNRLGVDGLTATLTTVAGDETEAGAIDDELHEVGADDALDAAEFGDEEE